MINIELITPFAYYEKFSLNLDYQNDQMFKVLKALVIYPLIEAESGIDLALKLHGVEEFRLSASIALPFEFYHFKYGKIAVNHLLTFKNNDKLNSLQAFTQVNDFNMGLKFNTVMNVSTTLLKLDTYVGEEKFLLNLQSFKDSTEKHEFVFELVTPSNIAPNLKLFLSLSPMHNDGFRTHFSYNTETLWHVDFIPNTNEIYFYINNIWQLFKIEYKYSYINDLETYGHICWDQKKTDSSQAGFNLVLGTNTSITVILPTRVASLSAVHLINSSNQFYSYKISWSKNNAIGLSISHANVTENNILILRSSASLTLPYRIFTIIDEMESSLLLPNYMKTNFIFMWDKQNTSMITLQNYILPGKLESRLSMPALMHDIILRIDTTAASKIPSALKAQIEYADDIAKKVEVEMYYNQEKLEGFHTERRFVLRYPASKMDYDLRFSTSTTQRYTWGNISLFYNNYLLNQRECIKSSLAINHQKLDIAGEIQTNKNYFSLRSMVKSGISNKGFSATMQINDKEPLTFSGIYNFKPKEYSIYLLSKIGSNRAYRFFAGLPSKREITAKLTRTLYDSELVDGLLTLRLNNSQILWLKLQWKNHLISHFKSYIFNEYYDLRYIIEATGQELIDAIDDSIGQQFIYDMLEIQHNFSSNIMKGMSNLNEEYKTTLMDIKEGYKLNSFYIRDIGMAAKAYLPAWNELKIGIMDPLEYITQLVFIQIEAVLNETLSMMFNICDTIKNYQNLTFTMNDIRNVKLQAKEIFRNGINDARDALKQMDSFVLQLLNNIDESVAVIKEQCENAFEPYIIVMDDFINYLEQRLTMLQIMLLDILDSVQHYIMNLRECREVMKTYLLYMNWLEELHITNMLEPIGDIVEAVLETIIVDLNKVLNDYKPYFSALTEAIFGNYKEINELPPLMEFREICNNLYERTLWIWNYHNLSKIIKSYIHQIISNFDDYFASFMELEEGGNDFENVLGQSNYVFRPDLGVVEITQPLPVEWEAFDEIPHFEQESLYQKIKRRSEHLIQLQRTYFVDLLATFNNYLGKPTTVLLSPSTNNIASVVGKSHYITFDKKYYNFVGQCSYLLASDLIGNSFSVRVNYANDNSSAIKKSISVISNGNNFEVSPEFGVKLNGQSINLPFLSESLSIIHDNYLIIIENSKGLKLVCNLYYDYCTVELSGWLFGRTGGLLGTLDNEKVTDMSLPDGDHTSDVLEFVQSWQMKSPKCVAVNHAYTSMKISSPFATILFKTLCQVYFMNTNSPLGNCFNLVDPTPFYNMCVNSMKAILNPTICASIASYRGYCEKAGIFVKIPEICISCNYGVGQNEDIFDTNNPKSVDVVVIKDACFSSKHNVSSFVQHLDQHLASRHFTNNQFAVVGFGYCGKPFVYTNGKRVWTNAVDTIMHSEIKPMTHYEKASAMRAINFASNLEFRPGVSKMFVLMHCDSKYEEENLNNLYTTFGERDITLHVLKTQVMGHNGDELFEMDKKGNILYINHGFDVDALKVTAHIKAPNEITDIYSVLALSTNGSILRIDKNLESKVDEFSVHWSEIVSQSAKYSPCQRCKCIENVDGTGKVECKRCMSPVVKQLLLEYESNLMQFHTDDENK